ncbi:MAG: hypothetical protein K6A77_08595 [Clostridiales bacterium]|nr:hypothetical protein [Clostridiales bacterium]
MRKEDFSLHWMRSAGSHWSRMTREWVDLPDDHIINMHRSPDSGGQGSVGFFPSAQAVYEKDLTAAAGETVLMHLDGAYEHAEVFLNGDLIYQHPYGYTGVLVDLSEKLNAGENHLRITTSAIHPGSRWYTGGGLYREVTLYRAGRIWFDPYAVFITTPEASGSQARVRVEAGICGVRTAAEGLLRIKIQDPFGNTVAMTEAAVSLDAGKTTVCQELIVEEPRLWSTEDPQLYQACMSIQTPEGADMHLQTFGIRCIEIDAKQGFRLNGVPMKLRGGCIHHDNGMLGSAAYPVAEARKIRLLKQAGFNAIRTAHNPPSTALLDACDKMGMLVLVESFDVWRYGKNPLDYHTYFEKWWDYDTSMMVLRDRNHPSVFCWSIGNEIMEFDGNSNGIEWGRKQAELVRSLDPTRPVTSGVNCACGRPEDFFRSMDFPEMDHYVNFVENGVFHGEDLWGAATEAGIANLDIAGYNYHFRRYAMDREQYPDRVIMGTETRPALTWENWQAVKENPNCIGDFVWVAMDNLGEAGMGRVIWAKEPPKTFSWGVPYPWLSCWQGDLDMTGYRLPVSYYRNVVWGLDLGIHLFTRHPSRTGYNCYGNGWHWEEVFSSWTYEDEWIGKPVMAVAYTSAEQVRFLLNGVEVACVPTERMIARAEIPYQRGTLTAEAVHGNKVIANDVLQTARPAACLSLDAEHMTLKTDGKDLAYIRCTITDQNGIPLVLDDREIHVEVEGAGVLQGLGSGDPCTEEDYGTGRRKAFRGSVMAVVRAFAQCDADTIRVRFTAQGLAEAECILSVAQVPGKGE